jgi:hypothetical protein
MKVTYEGIELEVDFEYYKGEPQTWDYIGSADEVRIEAVYAGGWDIYELLNDIQLKNIEQIILDRL